MVNSWLQAVSEWRKSKSGKVLIPLKGSPDYNEIVKIQQKYKVVKEPRVKRRYVRKRETIEKKMGLRLNEPYYGETEGEKRKKRAEASSVLSGAVRRTLNKSP